MEAKFLNNCFTLIPVLALVSMNWISSKPCSFAMLVPSSVVTYLFSSSSSLFPTKTIMMSSPRWFLASDIHLFTFSNDCLADKMLTSNVTYKLCRNIQLLLMSLECIMVSSNGIFLGLQCPKLTFEPFYRQHKLFLSENQFPLWPFIFHRMCLEKI